TTKLSELLEQHSPQELSRTFDDVLRKGWPLAQVGFVVTLPGKLSCPTPNGRQEARTFCTDNGRFLACGELAEVYWSPKSIGNNGYVNTQAADQQSLAADKMNSAPSMRSRASASSAEPAANPSAANGQWTDNNAQKYIPNIKAQSRNVIPQQ